MSTTYLSTIIYLMWGLLIFTSVCFFISGIDDLFIDIYYWLYSYWRRQYIIKKKKKLSYEDLVKEPEKHIAIMVPCWHEAGVIEEMLKYNASMINYHHYDIFIGVYPNDPNTVSAVQSIADIFPNIHCIVGKNPGPTNKASNLNAIYASIMEYEKTQDYQYEVFVLHDSEDIIHPFSLLLYNYLTPKNDMIQIPILPLDISFKYLTHWTYNAEFSEIHTKDLVVREKIGGLVPSAGVGTAFTRRAIEVLKKVRGNVPFATNSLTEDYSTSLELRLNKLREIFVLQYIYRPVWRKKWIFFGELIPHRELECIATRAMFPLNYYAAVRQKTRWILGIVFQEWINTGWQGNLATLYTLIHDRKSIFTHLINALFLIQIPFWISYYYFTSYSPDYPTLSDLINAHPWVWGFIGISTLFMLNRFLQRIIATYRVYGFFASILSIPLIFYGNVINLHALLRAYHQFFFNPTTKTSNAGKWDKTDHTFPMHDLLKIQKIKLGDLLIQKKLITNENLIDALNEQTKTGEQLGNILIKRGYISSSTLCQFLADQYHMKIIKRSELKLLTYDAVNQLSKAHYRNLIANHCYPIQVDGDQLLLALDGHYNEDKLLALLKTANPYKARFAMLDPND